MNRDHQAEFAIAVVPGDLDAELEDGLRSLVAWWRHERSLANP